MKLKLNCISPWDELKPYPKQQEFLELDRSVQDGRTSRNHWIGGRGSGKTLTCVLLALRAAFELCPGLPGMVTEPSGRKMRDIFIPLWCMVVPNELYTLKLSDMSIHLINGSVIYLRSRHVDNPYNAMLKGMNVAWCIDDESAEKFLAQIYDDIDMAIRVKSPYRFHDTVSTPIMNEYYDVCHREHHTRIHTSSHQNPHLPPGTVDDWESHLSNQYKAREIDGQFVPLSGLLWPEWSMDEWPTGNIHPHTHNRDLPYYLAFDIGVATSAWLIIQPVGDIWVVTAEYMPKREGSIDTMAPLIDRDFGRPMGVTVGADVNTRGSAARDTGLMIIRKQWGGGVPVFDCSGWMANKELQHMQLSYGIKDVRGRRRFCVSKGLISQPARKEHNRGILEMVLQDAWPEKVTQKSAWASVKEHRLEHVRDAAMYFAMHVWPPRFAKVA